MLEGINNNLNTIFSINPGHKIGAVLFNGSATDE